MCAALLRSLTCHACQLTSPQGHKFAAELEAYTPQELSKHQEAQHPACQFCRTRFYGSDELYNHVGALPSMQ